MSSDEYQGFDRSFLQECFSFDSEGRLHWRHRPLHHFATLRACRAFNKRYGGTKADTSLSSEYRTVHLRGKRLLCHRVIFLMANKYLPEYLDHINRDKLDNRIVNLRETTLSQNSRNSSPWNGCRSKYKGVHFHEKANRWRASIKVNYKSKYLGLHDTEEQAAKAYDREAKKHGFITNSEIFNQYQEK